MQGYENSIVGSTPIKIKIKDTPHSEKVFILKGSYFQYLGPTMELHLNISTIKPRMFHTLLLILVLSAVCNSKIFALET